MAVRPFHPIREIISSGEVLFANPILALPNVVAALVPILVILPFGGLALMSPVWRVVPINSISTPLLFVGLGIGMLVGIVLAVIATGALYRGAADALTGHPVTISSLVAAGLKNAWNIVGFFVILFVVGLVAELIVGILAMMTQGALGWFGFVIFFVAALFAGFTLVYALPALVVGGKSPGDAIIESGELAWTNVGATMILVVAAIIMAACAFGVEFAMGFGPSSLILTLSKVVVNALVQLLFVVLAALFAVRFYMLLSDGVVPVDVTAPPDTPPALNTP
jgi:membrane-anchored glycerophosphoryl diester phosphodiesterase (GDPDase)